MGWVVRWRIEMYRDTKEQRPVVETIQCRVAVCDICGVESDKMVLTDGVYSVPNLDPLESVVNMPFGWLAVNDVYGSATRHICYECKPEVFKEK